MTDGSEAALKAQHQGFPFVQTSSAKRSPQGDYILPEPVCGRFVHLDVTRLSCILVIALCAGEPSWLEYNTLFFQNWVVQYLWLVCGICYGLSSRPLLQYLGRLLLFFSVGIAANFSACRIKKVSGLPVGGNMWFVAILVVFGLLLKPLKMRIGRMKENSYEFCPATTDLRRNRSEQQISSDAPGDSSNATHLGGITWMCSRLAGILLLSSIVILSVGTMAFGDLSKASPKKEEIDLRFVRHFCVEIQACLSAVWIVWAFPQVFTDMSIIGWLLLVNMYTFKLICGYGEMAFLSSGFQLLLIGLTVGQLGLAWRQELSHMVQRYWMVVVFLGACCFLPGTHGMLMMLEPESLLERQQFILLEALLVIVFLVAGAEMVDPNIFEADNLTWLSDWASLLFLLHQAVIIAAPQGSWLVFIGLMPVSWIFRKISGGLTAVEMPDESH